MVADDYFDQRSRLGAALFSLGHIADQAGLGPSRSPLVESLVEGLRDPFLLVVAGEVNAGKSTLLNALFGEEFCGWGGLPETQRIHYFRYGKTLRRIDCGPLLEEVELPCAFLRDFHVVDSPGINSIAEDHERITQDFIPRADAVLFCFSAAHPWSAAGWEFLGRIHRDGLRKIVLVLQQADLRTPEEAEAIAEHLRTMARQRLGVEVPVFPVSARLALLARTSGVDKPRLLAESAFPAFEQQLNRLLAGTAQRSKLMTACAAGQAILAEIQAKLTAGAAALTELNQLRENVRAATAQAGAAAAGEAKELTRSLNHAWQEITTGTVTAALAERRAFPRLLLGRDATADTIESRLLPPLLNAVREEGRRAESRLDQLLSGLWKQPGSAIHCALEARVHRPPEPDWPSRQELFLPSLENAVCEAVSGSGLAGFWQDRLRLRRGQLMGLTLLALLITAAVTAGILTRSLPMAALGWLAAMVPGAILTGRTVRRRETAETACLAETLCAAAGDQFAAAARPLAAAHGTRRIDDFRRYTAPLETAIQLKEQTAAPLAEEAGQLARTLQSLARSLPAAPPGPGGSGGTKS